MIRIAKSLVAFVLVFCMLAVTVVCAAVASDNILVSSRDEQTEFYTGTPVDISSLPQLTAEDDNEYSARLTAPAKDNPYYYSDKNVYYKNGYGMPNCTAYAFGRAYEILGKEPQLCIYDAYQWFDYNKDNDIYSYGTTPKLGAIVCFKYKGYDSGHVAVVEKIVGDTVYYSNSAWGGQEFYLTTSPIDDPTDGYDGWEFLGFIYIGEYSSGADDAYMYKITSTTGVNMRSGAGTSYDIVGAIPSGVTVAVIKIKENNGYTWGYTSYMGRCGWFVTDFAQLITEEDKPDDPPAVEELIGDADLDGEISVLDATQIQMFIAGLFTPTQKQRRLSDVDNDGQMSVMDASKIRFRLAGLE